jgi:hypothetical protein
MGFMARGPGQALVKSKVRSIKVVARTVSLNIVCIRKQSSGARPTGRANPAALHAPRCNSLCRKFL